MRRMFLKGLFGFAAALATKPTCGYAAQAEDPNTAAEQHLKERGIEHFVVKGIDCLTAWRELRDGLRGWPVIIGSDEAYDTFLAMVHPGTADDTDAILRESFTLLHPDDLRKIRQSEAADSAAMIEKLLKAPDRPLPNVSAMTPDGAAELKSEEARKLLLDALKDPGPKVGEWPATPPEEIGLSLAYDSQGEILPRVHILLVPASAGYEVPAYLNWGNWNSCPKPALHVAALKSWQERYGAELVGLSADVMILHVKRRPATREEALELTREQHLYCEDNVNQSTGTLRPQAALLMASDWWFFWWD